MLQPGKRFWSIGAITTREMPFCWIGRTGIAGFVLAVVVVTAHAATQEPGHEMHGAVSGAVVPNDSFMPPESTRRMIELVRQIHEAADPLRNPFRAGDQLPRLRAMEASTTDFPQRLNVKIQIAMNSLLAGDPPAALRELDAIDALLRTSNKAPDDKLRIMLLTARATCHLRAGETANCVANHNADSCLFPIKGGGVHLLSEGSQAAKAVLLELLARFPEDLRARWLLNIACMTLGEYPDKVPPRWLIPPERFASDYDIKRFPDVAGAAGLAVDALAGGVVLEDFDHDGFLDVMVSSWGFAERDQLRVFRNKGDGTFTERTAPAGLTGIVSGLNLIHGDYDNDGFADVLLLRGAWFGTEGHYPLTLLHNNGDFTFTDVTEQTGLISHRAPTQTAVWFDYNGDGWLDIFVGNESTGGESNPCELFRNDGDGTFTECAAVHGLNLAGYVKGAVSGDINNDGRPDLFLSTREGAPKFLLRNEGPAGADHSPQAPWRFTNVTAEAGITEPRNGFPCWFWDYDNDGWQDLMVTGYLIRDAGDVAADALGWPNTGHKARLYQNNGDPADAGFTDVSRDAGVNKLLHAMGANFGDLDNDGWLDFYVGTGDPDLTTLIPSRMFRNAGGQRFQDVTTSGGFGQLQKGHGIAFGDIDNDGDQDVYSVVGGAVEADNYPNQLFANPGHGNRWLKLQLEGVRTNRVAIGARIKVLTQEAGAPRAIHRTVGTGASFGANPLRQEIGLGRAAAIDRVEIFWPVTGVTQVVTGLEVDHAYRIREGETAAVPVALKGFVLPGPAPAGAHHH